MCTQIFVKFPCGCARKYETISCYEDYTCPLNIIKRNEVPVSAVKACQWICAYCPKAKQEVVGSAHGEDIRADGQKEAQKLKDGKVEAEE
jgi:hypothetical protein